MTPTCWRGLASPPSFRQWHGLMKASSVSSPRHRALRLPGTQPARLCLDSFSSAIKSGPWTASGTSPVPAFIHMTAPQWGQMPAVLLVKLIDSTSTPLDSRGRVAGGTWAIEYFNSLLVVHLLQPAGSRQSG